MPRARYYALILAGEDQEARPLAAADEAAARREAEALARSLTTECRVALFQDKRDAPIAAFTRNADGSVTGGDVE
jgi:hypothetical protein